MPWWKTIDQHQFNENNFHSLVLLAKTVLMSAELDKQYSLPMVMNTCRWRTKKSQHFPPFVFFHWTFISVFLLIGLPMKINSVALGKEVAQIFQSALGHSSIYEDFSPQPSFYNMRKSFWRNFVTGIVFFIFDIKWILLMVLLLV